MSMRFMQTDYNLNKLKPAIAWIFFMSSSLKDEKLYADHKVPIYGRHQAFVSTVWPKKQKYPLF